MMLTKNGARLPIINKTGAIHTHINTHIKQRKFKKAPSFCCCFCTSNDITIFVALCWLFGVVEIKKSKEKQKRKTLKAHIIFYFLFRRALCNSLI